MENHEVPIIVYHSINDHPEDHPLGCLSFTTEEFTEHLRFLSRAGYKLINCSELLERSRAGEIGKERLAVLTFDDGFLDNYLIAEKILEDFEAKATLFVNPGHTPDGPLRTLEDVPHAWGNVNFEEMRTLEKRGIFEIQSHTLTHDYIFVSDRLVDIYTPEKFDRYYWLAWRLLPRTKSQWQGDVRSYAGRIPSGYPIFEFGRSLQGREFIPSSDFIELCRDRYSAEGQACLNPLKGYLKKGDYETEESYFERIDRQLVTAKAILEREGLGNATFICFPGDCYTELILEKAADLGYQAYMRPPWDEDGGNIDALSPAMTSSSGTKMIGLKRICISYSYRGVLPSRFGAKWAVKMKVGQFIGHPLYSRIYTFGKTLKGRTEKP